MNFLLPPTCDTSLTCSGLAKLVLLIQRIKLNIIFTIYSNPAGRFSQIKMLLKHSKYPENYSKNDKKALKKTANNFLIDQGLY